MVRDVRLALRALAHAPLFTTVAFLTLALGLGATTAVFGVVHGVVLEPLPVRDPDRLISLRDSNPPRFPLFSVSPGNYLAWHRGAASFESMAAIATNFFILTASGEPERLRIDRATATLFDLLRVPPVAGRYFTADEDRPGGDPVVVLTEGLWRRRYAADPGVVGRAITLSGRSYTVIGVAPQAITAVVGDAQGWVPMAFDAKEAALHGSHYLRAYGRLRSNVTLDAARADLDRIAQQLEAEFPGSNKGWRVAAVPVHESMTAQVRPALWLLAGAVTLVLIIVCANVASLMLARGFGRAREFAVRAALGAERRRLIRELMMEGAVLAVISGTAAIGVAYAIIRALALLGPTTLPRSGNIELDVTVVAFAGALVLVTPALFAIVPALQVSRTDLRASLAAGGRSVQVSITSGTRAVLVTGQLAMAVMLLIGCSLLVRSFARLLDVDPGFQPRGALVAGLQVPAQKYPEPAARVALMARWMDRLRALPGVQAVGLTQTLPLVGDFVASLQIEGRPPVEPTERPRANFYSISPGFLEAMGIDLVRGRAFDERDRADAPAVAVINETFARQLFPNEDPLGRRIIVTQGRSDWREIVGVVRDTKQYGVDQDTTLQVYEPFLQQPFSSVEVVVRTSSDPAALTGSLRDTLRGIDAEQPLGRITTLQEVYDNSLGEQRFSVTLFGAFALVSLLLAAVGLYGLVSYTVGQRRQEIGIRVALGADRGTVLRLVMHQAVLLGVIGLAVGMAASVALTRLMTGLLFNTSPTDLVTFTVVPLLLLAIVVFASLLPALRAARLSPAVTLRREG